MHQQQIIEPGRKPVRRYDLSDLERIERRRCAYRVQGRTSYGSTPNEDMRAALPMLANFGSLAMYFRADVDVAAGLWGDQSGNNRHATEAVSAAQPTWVASNSLGRPCWSFDGTNDKFSISYTRAAPGTQPFFCWMVAKALRWSSANVDTLYNDGGCTLFDSGVTPQVRIFNGTNAVLNSNLVIGSYRLIQWYCSNAVGDYLKVGSSLPSTANPGNSAGTGTVMLGNAPSVSRYWQGEMCEFGMYLGTPTTAMISGGSGKIGLEPYISAFYGASLLA